MLEIDIGVMTREHEVVTAIQEYVRYFMDDSIARKLILIPILETIMFNNLINLSPLLEPLMFQLNKKRLGNFVDQHI